jgi:catechol 2,3-dioxygenase-like lactoylglutathione lyase family enzyme
MDRLNHVKIISPDPGAIDRFLREVLDVPEGWPLGEARPTSASGAPASGATGPGAAGSGAAATSPARRPGEPLTMDDVLGFRGGDAIASGYITGSAQSRQFQIFRGEKAHIWAVAVGTRHLERAHERCVERGIPCTDPALTAWGDGGIHFFFAEVGGILFEVMRAQPTAG